MCETTAEIVANDSVLCWRYNMESTAVFQYREELPYELNCLDEFWTIGEKQAPPFFSNLISMDFKIFSPDNGYHDADRAESALSI